LKAILVVQARTGSKRFPGKVLKKISNLPLVLLILKRLSFSKEVKAIVLATSKKKRR
jgi:spore coat polysaccharide biosynthesis protein SpsF (cytidylyltransferase family)